MRFHLSDARRIPHRGREYLFVIKNAAILELDGRVGEALDALRGRDGAGEGIEESVVRHAVEEAAGDEAKEVLSELSAMGLFEPAGARGDGGFVALNRVLGQDALQPVPLQSLIAHIAQDCNLRCAYCYADHGLYGAPDKKLMGAGTAREYVDLLIRESGSQRSLHFTFFGGEPLMNFPVIEDAVAYGRKKAAGAGKTISFSMTTNGTLFDEEKVRFVVENAVGVTVSLDGPAEVNDAVRPAEGGGPSYGLAMDRLRPLLERRRVPVRVTLTRRCLDVEGMVDHFLGEGFSEVGLTPAATLHPALRLQGEDWDRLGEALARAAGRYQEEALAGRRWGFTNASNLLKQYHQGASRGYPCGAGAGLLAGNASGEIYACHRNVNDPRFALGALDRGIDREAQRTFLAEVHVAEKPHCDRCWLRSLCAGGCYHVGAMLGGRRDSAPEEMCDHIRRWYLDCLRVYLTLLEDRPEHLERLCGEEEPGMARDPHLNPFLD